MNRNHFEQVHGAYYFVWRWTNFNTLSSCFFPFCCCAHFFVLYLMKLALELISSEDDWCLCCTSLSSLWLDSFLYENILIKCILQFALFSSSMSGFRWVYMQKRYKLISLKYWVLVVHADFFLSFYHILLQSNLLCLMQEDDFLKTIARRVNVLQMIYFFPRCNFWVLLSTILRSNISAFETCIFH